ncbi:sigma-70 family RNA polymerase sigma factor [Tundrisphaera lichenicola]|uniref:sigma-70 family RNA polymerase sigma factor n=1 Tax=Tundrisphaera lichenicola TaxID=2029860 RepID=UPI003EBFFB3E
MRPNRRNDDANGFSTLDDSDTKVLSSKEERQLLQELGECKRKLAEALEKIPGYEMPRGADDPQTQANHIASFYTGDGQSEARLGAIFRRYSELRGKLALANMRLIAHVAKRFRDRGVSYSDLLQEGFCGLLEAIDRFDLNHQTKLATYATWWIRQAMQRAVASCAYPVRLSPRHLRQLAQNQDEVGPRDPDRTPEDGLVASTEMIQRIHTATRPTISLDATLDSDSNFNLMQIMSDPEGDRTGEVDMDETVGKMMDVLRPREQEVLALRFGLGGKARLSLSQVGKVLAVSKERVRQIQDRALEKLRLVAGEHDWDDSLLANA